MSLSFNVGRTEKTCRLEEARRRAQRAPQRKGKIESQEASSGRAREKLQPEVVELVAARTIKSNHILTDQEKEYRKEKER